LEVEFFGEQGVKEFADFVVGSLDKGGYWSYRDIWFVEFE
jgi:hypothetical protein